MRITCRLGLHTPTWRPAYDISFVSWIRIRTCLHCGRVLNRHPWYKP